MFVLQLKTVSHLPKIMLKVGEGASGQKQLCLTPKPFHSFYYPQTASSRCFPQEDTLGHLSRSSSEKQPMWAGGSLWKG